MSSEDPELRRMLALYREQRSPDAEQQARVWDSLDAQLAPVTTSGAAPAARRSSSTALAVRVIAALVLIGAGGALWIGTRTPSALPEPALPKASASQPTASLAPAPPAPPVASRDAEPAVQLAAPPPTTTTEARPAPRTPSEPTSARALTRAEPSDSSLAAELALLQAAHASLDAGQPARALRALRRHAARFAGGALAEEREAALVETLCEIGRAGEARRVADRFARRFPASPRIARVQAHCVAVMERE